MSARALQPLGDDLRRMAPVWGIVVGTAVVAVFAMRYVSMNFLTNALTVGRSGCEYAELYVASGRKRLEGLRTQGAELRAKAPDLSQPSLGLLAGKPALEVALADFRKATDLCAVNAEAHYFLSTGEWYAGNASAAYYHLGLWQQLGGQVEGAVVSLQTALDNDPENADAQRALARAYRELGRNADALLLVEKNAGQFESTPGGRIAAGMVFAAAGRTAEAEKLLREGLKDNPTDIPAMRELVTLMQGRKAYSEAGDFLYSLGEGSKMVVIDSYHQSAICYGLAGDLPNQEKALRRGMELGGGNNVNFLFDLAVNQYKQKRPAAARDELRRAMDRDTNFVLQRIKETGVDPRK